MQFFGIKYQKNNLFRIKYQVKKTESRIDCCLRQGEVSVYDNIIISYDFCQNLVYIKSKIQKKIT